MFNYFFLNLDVKFTKSLKRSFTHCFLEYQSTLFHLRLETRL